MCGKLSKKISSMIFFVKGPPILQRYAIGDEECKRAINDENFAARIAKVLLYLKAQLNFHMLFINYTMNSVLRKEKKIPYL